MLFFRATCLIASLCLPLAASAEEAVAPRPNPSTAPSEKKAWVGVAVSPATPSLRHQLKTPDGIGLVIEFVQPGSPAEEAGLKPFDLLEKLDDQWLVNPEQFAVLVHMRHAGDQVALTFVRQGAEQTAHARLVEHDVAKVPEWEGVIMQWPEPGHPVPVTPPALGHTTVVTGPARNSGQRVITLIDGHRKSSICTVSGHTTLDVKDMQTGQTLFSGPIDTEAQRKALPPELRIVLDSASSITMKFEGKDVTPNEKEATSSVPPVKPDRRDSSDSR
jgi:hypothetical protein